MPLSHRLQVGIVALASLGVVLACAAPGPTEAHVTSRSEVRADASCSYTPHIQAIKDKCASAGMAGVKTAEKAAMDAANRSGSPALKCTTCHLNQTTFTVNASASSQWLARMAPFFH